MRPLADMTVAATPISEPNAETSNNMRPAGSAGPNLSIVAIKVTTVIATRMKAEKYLLNFLLSTVLCFEVQRYRKISNNCCLLSETGFEGAIRKGQAPSNPVSCRKCAIILYITKKIVPLRPC